MSNVTEITHHDNKHKTDLDSSEGGSSPKLSTARLTREQGRTLAAGHLKAAIRDIDGASCESVARAVGFKSRDLVSRQCLGHKPIQLGGVYAMPRSVALRLLRSVLADLESAPDTRCIEAVAMRACGHAAGLAARIAEILEDGIVDDSERVELRSKAHSLVNELLALADKSNSKVAA